MESYLMFLVEFFFFFLVTFTVSCLLFPTLLFLSIINLCDVFLRTHCRIIFLFTV